jgi:hypothetical protein
VVYIYTCPEALKHGVNTAHYRRRLERRDLAEREVSASDGDRLPAVQMVYAQKEGWKSYTDAATSRLVSPRPT